MCFSAEADLLVGLVVIGVGIDATQHTRHRSEVPIAALPLLLGVHQVVESLVWLGLERDVPDAVYRSATWAYLLIACVLLPVYVPVAVYLFEPAPRRRWMFGFLAVGAAVSLALFRESSPVPSWLRSSGTTSSTGSTCGTSVWSSRCTSSRRAAHSWRPARPLRWFGGANVVAAGFLAWLDNTAFVSLWCLWAAIVSLVIALHLRRSSPHDVDDAAPPGGRPPAAPVEAASR